MATNFVLEGIGIGVNKIQGYLNLMQERGFISTRNLQDGINGVKTQQAVKEWQAYAGLPIDGIIGYDTFSSIVDKLKELSIISDIPVATSSYHLSTANYGLSVFKMQEYLNEIAFKNKCLRQIPVDGIYGQKTVAAVQQFQYLYGLNIDGVIGSKTWDAIVNERNDV